MLKCYFFDLLGIENNPHKHSGNNYNSITLQTTHTHNVDTSTFKVDSHIKRSPRGGSRISGKGVRMYEGEGVRFADLSHFSTISHKNEITWV